VAGCGDTTGPQAEIANDVVAATTATGEPTVTLPRERLDPAAKKSLGGVGIFETLFNPSFRCRRT
jgi:hypothetical protein